ncbi:HD domain-containing protein [Shewanella algae]
MDTVKLLPLEKWLKYQCINNHQMFPAGRSDYFTRYQSIKSYLVTNVYGWIGAGTSAEDQGVYTDHSEEHFNSVIRYATKLINFDNKVSCPDSQELNLEPYEVYVMLVSILLHDAGNIEGRNGHEKQPFKVFKGMGPAVCPDNFEGRIIANIAMVHGGKVQLDDDRTSKDTIGMQLKDEKTSIGGIDFRPKLIAALVRFADEICEDRSRAARYLINNNGLPKKSEVFHHYANSISTVEVDIPSKSIHLKFEVSKTNILKRLGKDAGTAVDSVYLIDEINSRLEKMFCELIYCRTFMYELVDITKVRATVQIYDDTDDHWPLIDSKVFELKQQGYPPESFLFKDVHPDWNGESVKSRLSN